MGVQYLSNPEDAAFFVAKDPEMAALIAGYLSAELSPAMKAVQQAQGVTAQNNQASRADAEVDYKNAVNSLAAEVKLSNDGWFDELESWQQSNYVTTANKAAYLGSWDGFHVFSGQFKSSKTKRLSKGYGIAQGTSAFLLPIHEDMAVVKALIKMSTVSGLDIRSLHFTYYVYSNDHRQFTHKAKQILEGNL